MIVYDPVNQGAFWCDITEYLRNHPERITDGPYTIRVPFSQPFNEHTFSAFYHHFAMYREIYKQDSYLGRALRDFANLENAEACLDGLFSLFSYHRHRIVSWYYMVSCFSNFAGHQVLRDLIIALCHVPGHPDIFWHKRNVIDHATRIKAQKLLTSYLDIGDVVLLLSEVDENGIGRGTIGQCIHAIIDIVHDRDLMLEQITFGKHTSEHVRYWSLILLTYYKQESELDAVGILRRYAMLFPDDEHICIIEDIIDSIRLSGGFTLY